MDDRIEEQLLVNQQGNMPVQQLAARIGRFEGVGSSHAGSAICFYGSSSRPFIRFLFDPSSSELAPIGFNFEPEPCLALVNCFFQ